MGTGKMRVSSMPKVTNSPEKAAFEILVSQYRADPKLLERHFPEVSQIVRQVSGRSRISRPHFSLTEREKAHHVTELAAVMEMKAPSSRDSIKALEHCAILIQDDFMTPYVNHQAIVSLFKSAFGKSPGSIRKNTTIPIEGQEAVESVYHASLVRGVVADLDLGMRLVSITITPRKIREGRKMMGIVGIGDDPCPDVSVRHDDYLTERATHGSS